MKRLLPIGLLAMFLAGCAGMNNTNNTGSYGSGMNTGTMSQAQIKVHVKAPLEQAANSAQASLQQLAAID